MTYLAGLLAVSLVIFAVRIYGNQLTISAPFRNLGFFKLHYLLSGIVFALIFPDDFMLIFVPARATILMFCLGWIGLYWGCGLELRIHQRFPPRIILSNLVEPIMVFVVISLIGTIYIYFKVGNWHQTGTALVAGLFASFTMLRRRDILYCQNSAFHHPVFDNLLPAGNIFPVIGLAVLGRLFSQAPGIIILGQTFGSSHAFFILQILTGICGGILLNMFVAGAETSDNITIILIGCTALISGITTIFSFSPLFVGTVTGVFLINSTLKRLQTLEALKDSHEFIEKVFMFGLGTMITPLFPILKLKLVYILIAAVGLFALRGVIKYILSAFWITHHGGDRNESPVLWIGLTGQGILASGAALECSSLVLQSPSVLLLCISLLVFNQIAISWYVWFNERNRRTEGAGDA